MCRGYSARRRPPHPQCRDTLICSGAAGDVCMQPLPVSETHSGWPKPIALHARQISLLFDKNFRLAHRALIRQHAPEKYPAGHRQGSARGTRCVARRSHAIGQSSAQCWLQYQTTRCRMTALIASLAWYRCWSHKVRARNRNDRWRWW